VEDNTVVGGFGSAVLELASSSGCRLDRIRCVGIPDAFVEHDTPEALRERLGLSADGIARSVRMLLTEAAVEPGAGIVSLRLRGGG